MFAGLGIAHALERLPNLHTPITPLPNGPHAIGVLLAGYGILNLALALCLSSKTLRLTLGLGTTVAYAAMLGVHYMAGADRWRAVFIINLIYALFALSLASTRLSSSRFKSVFTIQILATLVGVQGPLFLLTLVPDNLLQTASFGFDGWVLFAFPGILVMLSPIWAVTGSGIRIGFLLLLPPILLGYSFVHLNQVLASPSVLSFGLGGSALLLVIIVGILTASLREKKTTDEQKPNTQST